MSYGMNKNTARKLVRSFSRRSGFSERAYQVKATSRAGVCELALRRRVGPHRGDMPVRSEQLVLGRGPTWHAAALSAVHLLDVDRQSRRRSL